MFNTSTVQCIQGTLFASEVHEHRNVIDRLSQHGTQITRFGFFIFAVSCPSMAEEMMLPLHLYLHYFQMKYLRTVGK